MLIDTHTHLNFQVFDDWEAVVERAQAAGVQKMIVVGTDLESSTRAVEMAAKHLALYAAVGIHPHHARKFQITNYKLQINNQNPNDQIKNAIGEITKLAKHKRVVAIGEVGLDYHRYSKTKYPSTSLRASSELINLQKKLLGMQVELAKEINLPLVLHSREAGRDVLDVVEHFSKKDGVLPRGVFHCFDGSKSFLEEVLAAGFYVSFTGNVTYVPDRAEVALEAPLDRLLLETDCPYMPPRQKLAGSHLGGQASAHPRSEPKDVAIVAAFHAEQREVDAATIEAATTKNAQKLFKFKI